MLYTKLLRQIAFNRSYYNYRQRTSQQFMMSGLTSASPPKFVSLEEIMHAAKSMRDMALVHHIAVDDNFKLEPVEPEANSLHKAVKETMRRAFWDLLRQQLDENPPCFEQVLLLNYVIFVCGLMEFFRLSYFWKTSKKVCLLCCCRSTPRSDNRFRRCWIRIWSSNRLRKEFWIFL